MKRQFFSLPLGETLVAPCVLLVNLKACFRWSPLGLRFFQRYSLYCPLSVLQDSVAAVVCCTREKWKCYLLLAQFGKIEFLKRKSHTNMNYYEESHRNPKSEIRKIPLRDINEERCAVSGAPQRKIGLLGSTCGTTINNIGSCRIGKQDGLIEYVSYSKYVGTYLI